jgi:membrane protein required for colicin V production
VNRIDLILAVILALFALRGVQRGFSREFFALVGLVGGVAAAAAGWAGAAEMLPPAVPEIGRPFVAFALVFLGVALAAKLVGALVHRALGAIALSPLDRAAGAVFGAAKGVALVGLGLIVVRAVTPPQALERAFADSVLMRPLLELTNDGRGDAAIERRLPDPVLAPSPTGA